MCVIVMNLTAVLLAYIYDTNREPQMDDKRQTVIDCKLFLRSSPTGKHQTVI